MSSASLVFPHQLFEKHPAISKGRPVYLVEEHLFFTQYNFHKQKLVFHRASMKAYQQFLEGKGYTVTYIEAKEKISDMRLLLEHLQQKGISEIHYADVADYLLEKRIAELSLKLRIKVSKSDSPLFLLTAQQVDHYFVGKKRFYQTDFYTQQRKHFKVLVNEKLQPEGGKWTFDTENRLKYPKGKKPPEVKFPKANEHWTEATAYVKKNFPSNYGDISSSFVYPTTFSESRVWVSQFLQKRFAEFGDYEDALVTSESILHHSILTPMLNAGLLTPGEIIEEAVAYAKENKIPLNSCEGFIRQILGWREFIRGVYQTKGTQERTTNYWKFKRKIPAHSMKNEVICQGNQIQQLVPTKILSYEEALQLAFDKISQKSVISSWKDAISLSTMDKNFLNNVQVPEHGVFTDKRQAEFTRNKEEVIDNIWSIGGKPGWYFGNWMWRIRGVMDKMVGGVGLRRGRRSETDLKAGDALDFWRVLLADKPNGRLLLYAEMKLPGEAWLEFRVKESDGKKILFQTATYRPLGLWGRLYWYSVLPFHGFIFPKMAKNIVEQ